MTIPQMDILKKNKSKIETIIVNHRRIARIRSIMSEDIVTMPNTDSQVDAKAKIESKCSGLITTYHFFDIKAKTQKGIDTLLAEQETFLKPYAKVLM